jgi:hypothetical protein
MPTDRELGEFMEAHPDIRVLNTKWGETPVVPFYDVVDALRQTEERLWGEFLAKSNREDVYDRGVAAGQRDALAKAQQIVRGFTEPGNGKEICDKAPECDLCVVGPLIVAALEDAKGDIDAR